MTYTLDIVITYNSLQAMEEIVIVDDTVGQAEIEETVAETNIVEEIEEEIVQGACIFAITSDQANSIADYILHGQEEDLDQPEVTEDRNDFIK